jgi:hypothetical protein
MSTIVHIGKRQLTVEKICHHLSRSHLLPQLIREIIIDEILAFRDAHNSPHQLADDEAASIRCYQEIAVLPTYQGMNEEQLSAIASRTVKLQRFKQENWGHKLGTYYLERKSQLDRVIYSMMRIADGTIAQEVYFRAQGGEKTFGELAWKYSQGKEARDGGKIGPVTIESVEPEIAQQLLRLQPGKLSSLFILNNAYTFVRLEEIIHAQFDEQMQALLLDELFEKWLKAEIVSEIGLVSLQPKIINPDRMSHSDYPSVLPTLAINPSIAPPPSSSEHSSSPSTTTNPDESTLERGDTGLLLSQLQAVAQGETTAQESQLQPLAAIQPPPPQPEEQFTLERGDTGLLLSQLQAVAQGETTAQKSQPRPPIKHHLQPLAAIQSPLPQPEEQFTLERGDTGLLLSQLQAVAQGEPTPAPAEQEHLAQLGAPIDERLDEGISLSPVAPKSKKLWIALLTATVAIGSGIGSFSLVRSMGLTPIIRMMQK